ncbi:MAG: glycerophosphodiester phosphodiesterase family protein [Desulfobacterales bacterium]
MDNKSAVVAAWAERLFFQAADLWVKAIPRTAPSNEKLKACRLIAHRGVYDNRAILENSLKAFDRALSAGIWGIELDIRWTKDRAPVVIHDPDCRRLHARDIVIAETFLDELKESLPEIPTLEQVILRYGRKLHLMAEIKNDFFKDPGRQNKVLADLFSGLTPGRDFHLISLNPEILGCLTFVPRSCMLPIARHNAVRLSRLSIEKAYGGLAGHYALLGKNMIRRHHDRGQKIGTGFINSRNALFREISRGVDWIFSDCADKIQQIIDQRPARPFPAKSP